MPAPRGGAHDARPPATPAPATPAPATPARATPAHATPARAVPATGSRPRPSPVPRPRQPSPVPRPRRPEAERRPASRPVPAVSPGVVRPPSAPLQHTPAPSTPGPGLGTPQEWASAVLAALGTLAVLAIPGAVLAVALSDGSNSSPLLVVPVAVALAVGGSVGVDLGRLGLDGAGTPLLVTLAAMALGTSLVVARARPAAQVPAQAVRALVVFVVGLTAVALAGRGTSGGGTLTVAVAPTVLGGLLWFAGALALGIAWRRPEVLPPGARRVRDLLAGPTAGIGAVLGASWLGGLALVVAGTLAGASDPSAVLLPDVPGEGTGTPAVAVVVAVVVFAPAVLLGALAFCLGVPVVARTPFGDAGTGLVDLLGVGPSWWLAPLVGVVVCTLGGMAAALHAPTPDAALRRGWALGPALAVVLGLVAVVTAVSAGPFAVRLDLAPAVVLGLAWGSLGGLLGALVAPGLPAPLRGGRLGPASSAVGQVVGVLLVVSFLGTALAIGLAAANQVG
ncbi:hypothetical protein [Actinomycetospora atypica]|uniref:Uncharacterized protein n=1 Tax=Actinomycetospora atypica TaxID=1290095 RepID=A0ABV9YMR3_9PSEU